MNSVRDIIVLIKAWINFWIISYNADQLWGTVLCLPVPGEPFGLTKSCRTWPRTSAKLVCRTQRTDGKFQAQQTYTIFSEFVNLEGKIINKCIEFLYCSLFQLQIFAREVLRSSCCHSKSWANKEMIICSSLESCSVTSFVFSFFFSQSDCVLFWQ